MASRATYSGSSAGPITGPDFLDQYSSNMGILFDYSSIHLTGIAGTANAVTAVLDPGLLVPITDGMKFSLIWGSTNTGPMTLKVNLQVAYPVVDASGAALVAGAVVAGLISEVIFVGGKYYVLSPLMAGGSAQVTPRFYWRFTASGTWSKPAGLSPDAIAIVEVWGGGGGGRSASSAANHPSGGAGGGYIRFAVRVGALPSTVAVTIGAGGAGGLNANGAVGGFSSFGAIASALGGGAGVSGGAVPAGGSSTLDKTYFPLQTWCEDGGQGGRDNYTISTGPPAVTSGVALPGDTMAAGAGGSFGVAAGSPGGSSKAGGDGGDGGDASPAPTAGSAPGGGGGGSISTGVQAGAGARGEVRITI